MLTQKASGVVRRHRTLTWANAELLLELIRARFKASDNNTALGMLWSLIGPITMLLVMYLIFSTRFGAGIEAYPLYLLIGIVLVGFFVTATRYLISALAADRRLILNSSVPHAAVLISNTSVHSYKLLVELGLCAALSAYYGLFSWRVLVVSPPLILAFVALTLGVGMVLATCNAFARDMEHVWVVGSWMLYFATPVFYDLGSLSPLEATVVYWLNPLTPFLLAFRDVLIGDGQNLLALVHSLVLGIAGLAVGCVVLKMFGSAAVERT
jgi:lipopolysaccharide transport system permease protein